MSSGWHELLVTAADLSGKTSELRVSFYVDTSAPIIVLDSSEKFVNNSSLIVNAIVSDDFRVAGVLLHYELRGGGTSTIAMIVDGQRFIAELDSALLWDGMSIYVTAIDFAGNVGESPRIILTASASPPANDDGSVPSDQTPAGDGNHKAGPIPLPGSLGQIMAIALMMAASVISVALFVHRRRPTESSESGSASARIQETREAVLAVPMQVAAAMPSSTARTVSHVNRIVTKVAEAPLHAAVLIGAPRQKPLLVDAIPQQMLKDPASEEDDIDYGELIERELSLSVLKRSIFRENAQTTRTEDSPVALREGPIVMSGLELKKLMDSC